MADLDLKRDVQGFGAPDYSPGYTAPDTLQDQAVPVLDTAAGAVAPVDAGHNSTTYALKGDSRRAQRGAPNDYGWRHQDRLEIGGYRETSVYMTPQAGATITINPDHATAWELAPQGALTIQLTGGEGYDPPDPNAPAQSAIVSVELFILRIAGATINWPGNVRWSSAALTATSFSAPSAARLDTYVLVYLPNLALWIGHIVAQGYGPAGTS